MSSGRFLGGRSAACLVLAALCGGCAAAAPRTSQPAAGPIRLSGRTLSISGNHFVDSRGATVRLLGVNRAGLEFACVQGWGIFDGPSDAGSVAAMAAWHINAVRLPLNEDCWLGINGVRPAYAGERYRQAVEQYVALLHDFGLTAILDLHWTAPGSITATKQLPMADADHAPAFWRSVAAAFRFDSDVVFDLFNEPYLNSASVAGGDVWSCWLLGCTIKAGDGVDAAWRSAGMQSLLDAVRGTGALQPVIVGGLSWSSDLSGWLNHAPHDPEGQLGASFHVYNFSGCSEPACWESRLAPVAAKVPLITGELGENDCSGGFVGQYMGWADTHGVSYLGWTWNTWGCGSGPALIASYSGVPTRFGAALEAHLAALSAARGQER